MTGKMRDTLAAAAVKWRDMQCLFRGHRVQLTGGTHGRITVSCRRCGKARYLGIAYIEPGHTVCLLGARITKHAGGEITISR